MANNLNKFVCLSLPQEYGNSEPFVATAIDLINGQEIDPINDNCNFCQHANLPSELILQKGAHVMYLDNTLFERRLCNRSIGIVTNLEDEDTVTVIFPTSQQIIIATIKKVTN
ncbi:ATP-dependent DNA helicase PIF1 [Gigaspora margarita]|uniref:ATP-dependent DNA helicase PIF1 n=1 Tax=Gigaspora margarita TaxID=4874 RepID=A0A8H4B257_GIGMA|nr:ATP-dependent DNA helicase PIF1 [Gigaspora margarita]